MYVLRKFVLLHLVVFVPIILFHKIRRRSKIGALSIQPAKPVSPALLVLLLWFDIISNSICSMGIGFFLCKIITIMKATTTTKTTTTTTTTKTKTTKT